jgi:hypothetical protein
MDAIGSRNVVTCETLRSAKPSDVARVADLMGQLGYRCDEIRFFKQKHGQFDACLATYE